MKENCKPKIREGSLPGEKMTENNCRNDRKVAAMRGTNQPPKRERGERIQQVRRVFRCWQCGEEGHQRVECPSQGSQDFYTCQAYGHLSRECPAKNALGGQAVAHVHQPQPNIQRKEKRGRGR
ncbi:uncharacterized protein [Palaemon carinicauda]|uniref:uncharacterized protein n=1 Tax=Palaemon carinicauda TaxID=392227 RepID=UPI0035B695E7